MPVTTLSANATPLIIDKTLKIRVIATREPNTTFLLLKLKFTLCPFIPHHILRK